MVFKCIGPSLILLIFLEVELCTSLSCFGHFAFWVFAAMGWDIDCTPCCISHLAMAAESKRTQEPHAERRNASSLRPSQNHESRDLKHVSKLLSRQSTMKWALMREARDINRCGFELSRTLFIVEPPRMSNLLYL